MEKTTKFILLTIAALLWSGTTQAQTPATRPATAQTHVLILVGSPGTPLYARHYADWSKRFEQFFAKRAPQAKTAVLSGDSATTPAIRQKIAELAQQTQAPDQFVLILLGHGGADGAFVVPGPDLSAKDLSDSLAAVKAQTQVVLNFSSSSGAALRTLRQPGRIVITANSAGQSSDTDYAEFFLQVLESAGGQSISVLEVFNKSSYEHAQWITRQRQTEEGWTVEGRKSLETFKKLYGGPDVPASRKLAASGSDGGKDDPILPLVPDNKPEFWKGRRLVSEHALIEDTGQTEGVSAVASDGHHPVEPKKDGDVGTFAKRIVLGKPEGGSK